MTSLKAYQNQVIRDVMIGMVGHPNPSQARDAWWFVLAQLDMAKHSGGEIDQNFLDSDGVRNYVNTAWIQADNYQGASKQEKAAILQDFIYATKIVASIGRNIANMMGEKLEPDVKQDLWGCVYFHERISDILTGYYTELI